MLLLDLLFPPRCTLCHGFLDRSEKDFCFQCRENIPVLPTEARIQFLPGTVQCVSLFRYEGSVRDSLLRYKFGGLSFYGKKYGRLLTEYLQREDLECDVITWVPLSRKRLRKRGYDQAEILARTIAKEKGIPCEKLLEKIRNAAPQSGRKSREERQSNIRNAYRPARGKGCSGKTVLLIDDIITTGATLAECASVLLHAGAYAVKAVTVARTDLQNVENSP